MVPEPDDHRLARRLAEEAGRRLVSLRARNAHLPAEELRALGDRQSDDFLVPALAAARPGDGILSEESADTAARLALDRVWIVDPLDGTREFGEAGRTDWAVHVALAVGGVAVVGAVALPARGLTLTTLAPPRLPPTARRPRMVVSRSRAPRIAFDVAEAVGAEVVELGSAGAKTAAIVLGEAELYVHDGGMYEWDSCAPVAVAAATGLKCARIDGSPLRYNNPDPSVPDLVICRDELVAPTFEALARLRA